MNKLERRIEELERQITRKQIDELHNRRRKNANAENLCGAGLVLTGMLLAVCLWAEVGTIHFVLYCVLALVTWACYLLEGDCFKERKRIREEIDALLDKERARLYRKWPWKKVRK